MTDQACGFRLRFLDGCPEIPPVPSEHQIQYEFDEFLSLKHVHAALQEELNATESPQSKWAYVFLSKLPRVNDTEEWLGPHECVGLIQRLHGDTKCVRDLFLAVRLNILLRPSSWVEGFISEKGVNALMTPLQVPGATTSEASDEVISTMFILTSSPKGVAALAETPACCHRICSIFLYHPSNKTKTRTLSLLGVLCSDSSFGYDDLLVGLSSASDCSKDRSLKPLIATLEHNQHDIVLQAGVKFFNVLLESVRDKKQRASICDDVKEHGLLGLLDRYRNHHESDDSVRSVAAEIASQAEILVEHCSESTKDDKFGSLRLALGSAFNSMINSTPKFDNVSTSNQGETEEKPELDVVEVKVKTPPQRLEDILGQLQLQTKNLDEATSSKLSGLLQQLSLTLSDEAKAGATVDRLSKSLQPSNANADVEQLQVDVKEAPVEVRPDHPDLLTRVGLALGFPSLGESGSVSKPSTPARSNLFSSFSDFSLSNITATTPAKSSVSRPSFSSFIGADGASSPWSKPADSNSRRMSLPFFQSSRKGPGLGVTPASTPIATASVRKDAKRPVFPKMPSPPAQKEVKPSPNPPTQAPAATSPTHNLPPIDIAPRPETVTPLAIESSNTGKSSADVAAPATGTDISKFRKLLSMGAPREAVRAKMLQAGVNPDLLDEQQGFALPASPKTVLKQETPAANADVAKFRKLLSMGAPLAAVKAKMVQAGLDPTLLDNATVSSTSTATTPASSKKLVKDDDNYAKFFKLLSMGAPVAAVKAKMAQAGLNSDLLDTPDAEMPSTSAPSVPVAQTPVASPAAALSSMFASRAASQPAVDTKVKDDPQYAKFFKLLSMGAPAASVKAKMQMAGLNPELLDTPDAPLKPVSTTVDAAPSQSATKVKDDPAYAKFFKLLSMGAPPASVKMKMQMAGLKPELLDTPDAELPQDKAPAEDLKATVKVKDDPAYAKFFKLLSMGAPADSVKTKMQMAGLKPDLLDTPDAELPSGNTPASAQSQVKVKDDPAYAKFFKLLDMGAPAESVKAKMRMAGLQGDLLDTPDAFVPNSTRVAQPAAPAPTTAARRAHLSIAIKPVIKAKTRAFYWQQLKGETIAGTIWEELEKEQSNQSSQDFVTLTDNELELLETEFPPPAPGGPSTGTRRGSMIGSPAAGPGSPLGSPRIVFLIDRARSNNISIIVKQFRMSNAALRVAIMKMDSEVLTIERVQGLIKVLPTEEEIAAISGFNGDPTTLNGAELVLKELITVPRLKQRLSALETKHQFPALVRDLQTKVNKIRTASTDIAQSAELKVMLLVILQIGNKMNHGTARGGAKGFRLGDLTKLVQLKSVDKSVTLLHYLARMMRKKCNGVRLGDGLASLYDVQNIPIPELQADMNRLTDLTESINVELAAQRLKNRIEEKEKIDLFVESMTEFVESAATTGAAVKQELDETLRLMRDTMLRFDKNMDADESQVPPAASDELTATSLSGAGEFFSTIYEFTMSLVKADRENELKRIREEKRQKQQELKNAATPRRNSVHGPLERSALTNLNGEEKAAGPETQEAPRRKSMIAIPSSAPMETGGVSSLLPGAKPAVESTTVKVSETTTLTSALKKSILEAAKLKPTGIPKAPLRTPGKVVKASTPTGIASPLKKPTGITAIPSPMKLPSRASPAPSIERNKLKAQSTESAAPFDAASINEIKTQLETKHAVKNDSENQADDHDNNNSEPNSPEKTISEAEQAPRVAISSDA